MSEGAPKNTGQLTALAQDTIETARAHVKALAEIWKEWQATAKADVPKNLGVALVQAGVPSGVAEQIAEQVAFAVTEINREYEQAEQNLQAIQRFANSICDSMIRVKHEKEKAADASTSFVV